MFIYSLKASTLKFIAVVVISIGLLITLISVIPVGGDTVHAANRNRGDAGINFRNIRTNEDRIEFLAQFGWEINPEAVEVAEVIIPRNFDAVYTKYNEMQKAQSLNLERYRNRAVRRYTYEVIGYPDYEGTVFANLLVYRDRVIGGDICSAAVGGFMHGFDKNNRLIF